MPALHAVCALADCYTTPQPPAKPCQDLTVLYGLVAEQRATFAKVTRDEGGAPSFVDESFERFRVLTRARLRAKLVRSF
jgi:hypothetical protein